jgi:hypothetical protein
MKTIAHLAREKEEIIGETHAVVGDKVTSLLHVIGDVQGRGA